MNHCQLVTISSGRLPFSQNFTGWVIGFGSPTMSPDSVSSSTMRVCACETVRPAISVQGPFGGDALRRVLDDAAVTADDRAHRQPELAPPDDVGGVTERADHRDARPLLGIGELVCDDRDLDVEQRRAHGACRRAACSARRRDGRRARRTRRSARDGSSRCRPARRRRCGGTPMRWYAPGRSRSSSSACATDVLKSTSHSVGRLGEMGVPSRSSREERSLRGAPSLRADRRVGLAPVDREAHAGPQLEVRLLELAR